MINTVLSLLGVGLLWGATNPFIRLGSAGIDNVDTGSRWLNLWQELRMIGTRLHYWIPFLLNQLGSVLYVWTLQHINITIAVPVANSLGFAFTALTGYLLGEKLPGKSVMIGTLSVCFGSSLMLYDKIGIET
ncbi:transmembrane protein 234 homolog [Anastrepha ludens]|uniref:transmembrane protein 234 homolog n=1 Tax=Anastrepha ludens TaxID=28586 RepID=UPI0023AF98A5|nr:transmembrane protein 234 homolog [Anastrepha ludens]